MSCPCQTRVQYDPAPDQDAASFGILIRPGSNPGNCASLHTLPPRLTAQAGDCPCQAPASLSLWYQDSCGTRCHIRVTACIRKLTQRAWFPARIELSSTSSLNLVQSVQLDSPETSPVSFTEPSPVSFTELVPVRGPGAPAGVMRGAGVTRTCMHADWGNGSERDCLLLSCRPAPLAPQVLWRARLGADPQRGGAGLLPADSLLRHLRWRPCKCPLLKSALDLTSLSSGARSCLEGLCPEGLCLNGNRRLWKEQAPRTLVFCRDRFLQSKGHLETQSQGIPEEQVPLWSRRPGLRLEQTAGKSTSHRGRKSGCRKSGGNSAEAHHLGAEQLDVVQLGSKQRGVDQLLGNPPSHYPSASTACPLLPAAQWGLHRVKLAL